MKILNINKFKRIIDILFTKKDKKVIEDNIEIDYHPERDGNDSYPLSFVCNFENNKPDEFKGFLEYSYEQNIKKHSWIPCSNRLPKRLKKDAILPEYIIMIILTAIITLPYSIISGLIYILRRGHARISYHLHNRHHRFLIHPLKRFGNKIKRILFYGTITFIANFIFLSSITNKNGWNVFCNAFRGNDRKFLINNLFLDNLIIAAGFVLITGTLISIAINGVLLPTFFIKTKSTFLGDRLAEFFNIFESNTDDAEFSIATEDNKDKKELKKEHCCCTISAFYIPYREDAYVSHYYPKHAYIGELTWRFISPFAYRYYCMAHGYFIPIRFIFKRKPIPYSIFYKGNPMAQKSKKAKYFTSVVE